MTVAENVDAILDAWLAEAAAPDASAAELLCDRHDPSKPAFVFIDADLGARTMSYGELADASKRIAAALRERGVKPGDKVATLMGKREELVVAILAIWRLGATHLPLFTAFATPAIEMRMTASGATVVVTEASQLEKLAGLSGLDIILAGDPPTDSTVATTAYDGLLAHEPLTESVAAGGEAALINLFTSGTTGTPKAVAVPIKAIAAFRSYMVYGLDVREDDVFWNAADPGWAYGLYYGITGPMAIGVPNILLGAGFNAAVTQQVMSEQGVTNFAAAPTVYRSLRASKDPINHTLRRASSAGEPLTPDVTEWSKTALGVEVRDHYGQTEHGMMIVNCWNDEVARPVKPGSMGVALPGYAADVRDGQIVLDVPGSRLFWWQGYEGAPDKTEERYADGDDGTPRRWYLTGDTGRIDDDGYIFFAARDDDIILMAGYRIGPFDVESEIVKHPSVVDVAVVGRPDELRGEVAEAFVVLRDGVEPSEQLEQEIKELVRTGYATHAYPRVVHFVPQLPKTPSGKVQRFLLRRDGEAAAR